MPTEKISTSFKIATEVELAKRAISGTIAHPVILFGLYFITNLPQKFTQEFVMFSITILVMSAVRFALAKYQQLFYPAHRRTWLSISFVATAATALAWGCMASFTLVKLPIGSPETVLYLMTTGAMVAAAITTVGLVNSWLFTYILLTIGVPIVTIFAFELKDYYPFTFFFGTYMFLLASQGFTQSRHFRKLLHHQQAIQQQKDRVEAIFDAVPGLVTLIGPDMKYKMVSTVLLNVLGMKKEDFIGKDVGFLGNNKDFYEQIYSFSKSEEKQRTSEVSLQKDGGPRWALMVQQKVYDETTKKHDLLAICIDIQPLKDAESIINEQKLKAQYSAKMATLGEMASGIAHEINNPLAIIKGYSDELLDQLRKKETTDHLQLLKVAERISITTDRIARIVKSLRFLARDGTKDPLLATPLKLVIDDTVDVCSENLKSKDIELFVAVVPDDIKILCRGSEIAQVLLTLINNSRDAIESKPNRWIRVEHFIRDTFIEVAVVDSGSGIPQNIREKLFQPFFTTKQVGRGQGLALSIARSIVDQHSGEIFIDDKSLNTRFVVRLPKA